VARTRAAPAPPYSRKLLKPRQRPALTPHHTARRDADGRPARKPTSLTAGEVAAGVAPHARDIQRCYRDEIGEARGANHLELTLVIAYDGRVRSATVAVPRLAARTTRRMAACMRTALATARFPERRSDTMAILPYYFQKTEAPDAGPQLSCWNRSGCP